MKIGVVVLLVAAFAGVDVLLVTSQDGSSAKPIFSIDEKEDRLILAIEGQSIAEYVHSDPRILRPYFAQVRTPSGLQVTRNHPPVVSVDSDDHATMHPGIWLAFGDINGHDFWRNNGRIEHLCFVDAPKAEKDRLTFSTESRLVTGNDNELGHLVSRYELRVHEYGWRLDWVSEFRSETNELAFGDQEEMGFGARVATPLTEKNGGVITNSKDQQSAATTWGQLAEWCDYSGTVGDQSIGITLIPGEENFRPSWWHNRDYGVFVANPFGRAAMKQGEVSRVIIPRGESFQIAFAAVVHEGIDYDPHTNRP